MKQKTTVAEWLSGAAQWLVALASFAAFAILAAISLVQTCHVDIDFTKDNREHV